MVFRLDSGSIVPNAIAALSSGAKVDQLPRPMTKQQTSRFPVKVRLQIRSRSAGGVDPEQPGPAHVSSGSSAAAFNWPPVNFGHTDCARVINRFMAGQAPAARLR